MTVNTLDGAFGGGKSRGGAWLLPLAPIAISIFAISALVSYHLRADAITPRTMAQSVVIGIYDFLGWVPACMFFGLVFAWSSIWFVAGTIDKPLQKLGRVFLLTLALAVFGNLDASAAHTGALGSWIGGGLSSVLGSFLSHLVMAPLTFLALLFATDYFWMSFFERRVLERTKAELQSAAAVSDAGVEPAVPEEFKQLARSLPPEAHTSAADADAEEVDVEAYFDRLEQGRAATEQDAGESIEVESQDRDTESEVGADGEEPVRLSYFERRRLREEQEALRALQAAGAAQEQPAVDEVAPAAEVEAEAESSPVAFDDDAEPALEAEESVAAAADASEHVEESTEVVAAELGQEARFDSREEATAESTETVVAEDPHADFESSRASDADVLAAPATEQPSESVAPSEPALFAGLGETLPQPEASSEVAEPAEVEQTPSGDGIYEIRTEPLFDSAFAHVKTEEETAEAEEADADEVSDEEGAEREDAEASADTTAEIVEASREQDSDSSSMALEESPAEQSVETGSAEADRVAAEPDVVEIEVIEDEFDETAVEEGIRILGPVAASELPSEPEALGVADEPEVREEPTVEIPAPEPVADLSAVRPRGFLAPVVEDDGDEGEAVAEAPADSAQHVSESTATSADEPVVAIPRVEESPRQKSLFGNAADEALLREAQEICESAHRPSAVLLQRKLRIDFELARAVLAQLAERGIVELQEDGTQARVRS